MCCSRKFCKMRVLLFLGLSIAICTHAYALQEASAKVGSKVCYEGLGCFEITKDFYHLLYRPINVLPQDPATIDTEFHLYTKKNPVEYYMLKFDDKETMKHVDVTHRTVFIVHGFFENKYKERWMELLRADILLNSDFNVIIVDWSRGNGAPYAKASANARVVGAQVAQLIKALQENIGLDPTDVHIIGHSLGSHIAGYAGERIANLSRITALDPAGPYFQNMPTSVRLDPTDAEFVDVIHTDSVSVKLLALGMLQACGHIDFYPNNGMKQPGCSTAAVHSIFLDGLREATRRFMTCSHQRSVDFFLHSVNYKKALPIAFECRSWEDFAEGACSDCSHHRCSIMGMHADKYKPFKDDSKSKKMYMITSNVKPFWEYSFQITVRLLKPKSGFQDKKGAISLNIEGSEGKYDVTFESKDLAHGASYTYLVHKPEPLGQPKRVTLTWNNKSLGILFKPQLYVDYVVIKPMNYEDEKEQVREIRKFCNKGEKGIKRKETLSLSPC